MQDVGDDEPAFRIENSEISDNQTGGGINLSNCPSVRLTGNTITGNIGIFGSVDLNRSPFATLDGNTISGNFAEGFGGGNYISGVPSATLIGNSIQDNIARGSGGGVYMNSAHYVALMGNTLRGNTSFAYGGGIFIWTSHGATLSGNRFLRNRASSSAGALFIETSHDVMLMDSVLADSVCTSSYGFTGGVYVSTSQRLSLQRVSLLNNYPFELWNRNPFGPEDYDIDAGKVWWGTVQPDAIEAGLWHCMDDISLACVTTIPWKTTGILDFNGDGEILADDAGNSVRCLSGPLAPAEASCRVGDVDGDGDLDLFDFAVMQSVARPLAPD